MMKLYMIYDRVACSFGPVFEAINDGVGLRNFIQSVRESPNRDDFYLVKVGSVDKDTGVIEPCALWDVPGDRSFDPIEVSKVGISLDEVEKKLNA